MLIDLVKCSTRCWKHQNRICKKTYQNKDHISSKSLLTIEFIANRFYYIYNSLKMLVYT